MSNMIIDYTNIINFQLKVALQNFNFDITFLIPANIHKPIL